MTDQRFVAIVKEICGRDGRFAPDAYVFLREALDYTARQLDKPESGPERHVSGRELLEGFRSYALKEFGPMSLTVLNTWGLTATADVGQLVFNLVDAGILRKTEEDKAADFENVYDFVTAFDTPFSADGEDG